MRYSFKTQDDEIFVLDTTNMRWGRASSILASPSVTAVEKEVSTYVFSEEGELIARGAGVYHLEGRRPDTKSGPGAGLSEVGILAIPFEDTLIIYLKANVPLKEESFSSNPIKTVKYIISQPQTAPAPAVQTVEK